MAGTMRCSNKKGGMGCGNGRKGRKGCSPKFCAYSFILTVIATYPGGDLNTANVRDFNATLVSGTWANGGTALANAGTFPVETITCTDNHDGTSTTTIAATQNPSTGSTFQFGYTNATLISVSVVFTNIGTTNICINGTTVAPGGAWEIDTLGDPGDITNVFLNCGSCP